MYVNVDSIEKIKRNSFSNYSLENKSESNHYYKYHTIQNKKELFIKNKFKNNSKNIIKKINIINNLSNNNIKIKLKENIYLNNNCFVNINRDISENNSYAQENIIKTPKKIEDNFKLNPKVLANRLKKELYDFNNNYKEKKPENFI